MKEITVIPTGIPKSGRIWKTKQIKRHSSQLKQGILSHLSKTFEEKKILQQKNKNMKELEREMLNEKKQKKINEKLRREEQLKRRKENEYKNTVYQNLKPEKLKGMSKKQLRNIRKTTINQHGQVELVTPWGK